MPYRLSIAGSTSALASRCLLGYQGDVEAVIQLEPGTPAAYLGTNSAVGPGNGWDLVDGGHPISIKVRINDELWMIGTDPLVSSIVQVLVHSI